MEELSLQQVKEAFKMLPKGADLHSHYSSAVDYEDILFTLEEGNIYEQVYFNKKIQEFQIISNYNIIRENKQQFAKYFQNERYIRELISKNVQQTVSQPGKDGEETTAIDKVFAEYGALRKIFFNIVQGDTFYKDYIDLIYENMRNNSIYLQELRLKFDFKDRRFICKIDQILDHIIQKNANKQQQVRIIAQFPRQDPNLKDRIKQVIEYLNTKKRFQTTIIGIDFTGQESSDINKEIMEDKEILEELQKLNLQFYNHAGEMLVPEEYANDFGWENNHNFNNVLYILEQHQVQNKELYKRKIRIGHGIIFLQYLNYLRNDQKQQEKYQKYLKLSENVCFEVCPFANLSIYGGQLSQEIFENFADRICVCTDDQNKMEKNISDVYYYLYSNLRVEFKTLLQLIQNSIEFSGLEESEKTELKKRYETEYEEWESEYKSIVDQSQEQNIDFVIEEPWWKNEKYKKIQR